MTTTLPNATAAPSADESRQLAYDIAAAADERKGTNIVILPVADVSYLADYFVIITGFSTVQVRAITRSIEASLEEKWQRQPLRLEGQLEGNWVVMDYGDVIVHIFLPETREFYDLEAFWGHAPALVYQPVLSPPAQAPGFYASYNHHQIP
ncbi:MAG: ribosome silencing factor [Nodosilinea sp. LVE1205-7]|jgi:ribosome-associated protein